MTQPAEAVGGVDEPIIAAEPTIEDRFAALIEDEDPEGDPPPETPEGEPEDEDIEIEEEAETPILAPVSWTAEEKEEFASLPRKVQETLARRAGEQEKFLQAKSQEAKQARLVVEEQALGHIQQMQENHIQALVALLPQVPDKPSYALQAQDPQRFAVMMDNHERAAAQQESILQQIEQVGQQAMAQQQAIKTQQSQRDAQLLQEKFPEYLDPQKGPELRNSLRSTALALGYSDEQLANTDAHDILAMKTVSEWKAKADKLDTLMSKQMQRVRDGKKLPAISRPGAAQGKGATENRNYSADREAMRNGDRDATRRVFSRFV